MRTSLKLFAVGLFVLLTAFVLSLVNGRPAAVFSAQTSDPPDTATQAAFTAAGCGGCHTIPGIANAVGQVGPSLINIGNDAADRVSGQDAEAYISESVLDPNAFIAPECPNGECPASVMPPNMGERMAEEEIDLIVAHLLTLTGEGVTSAPEYELTPIEIERPSETTLTPFAEPPKTYEDAQVLLGKYLFFWNTLKHFVQHADRARITVVNRVTQHFAVDIEQSEIYTPGVNPHRYEFVTVGFLCQGNAFLDMAKEMDEIPIKRATNLCRPVPEAVHLLER